MLESSCASLHFISFELHPLAPNDWSKVVETRRKVLPIYTQIGSLKLPPLSGWHRRYLADGRVTLSVFHGDVADGLQDVVERHGPPVDIWFLDGFAPRRNEAMWSAALWRQIAAASRTGTRVATFTAASHVRRGLQSVGLSASRRPEPQKRESLAGTLTSIQTVRLGFAKELTLDRRGCYSRCWCWRCDLSPPTRRAWRSSHGV